jgi:hypothetical protein
LAEEQFVFVLRAAATVPFSPRDIQPARNARIPISSAIVPSHLSRAQSEKGSIPKGENPHPEKPPIE